MRGLPFNYQRKGTALIRHSLARGIETEEKASAFWICNVRNRKKGVGLEPRSVLDQRSPSPPTSTSIGGGSARFSDTDGVAAVSDKPAVKWPNGSSVEGGRKEEWTSSSLEMDWDAILTESATSPGQEHTFLHWIMGDMDDPAKQQQHLMLSSQNSMEFEAGSHGFGFGLFESGFGFEHSVPVSAISNQLPPSQLDAASLPLSLPPAMFFQEHTDDKAQFFGSNLLVHQFQQAQVLPNPSFFVPASHPSVGSELLLRSQTNQSINFHQVHPVPYHLQHRPMKPRPFSAVDEAAVIQQQQQQGLVDQLFKAAELVEAGNMVSANGILARLNHQLPSAIGKPFFRSAFYFKEALQVITNSLNPSHHRRSPFASPMATPLDVVLKLSAYKAFSEVSPILQFTNFTATQALLEELASADFIHIIDFDIGVGGQWSSFMQELAQRRSSSSSISLLKITAFVSPHAFHPLELYLTKENLSHFAADLNIPFEINIASIESFDPAEILVLSAGSNESIAVNLSVGAWQGPSFPTLLRLVKQLLPKIVISVDQGCDRGDLLFSHYLLHALQSCIVFLDSIDAAGTDQDAANKIERFVLQPRIENCVIGRHRTAEKMLPWRTLFSSAGFVPVQFSNFTESQAECLLKRVQVRGFHVEKRQASLYLYWQRGELASVSAWRY